MFECSFCAYLILLRTEADSRPTTFVHARVVLQPTEDSRPTCVHARVVYRTQGRSFTPEWPEDPRDSFTSRGVSRAKGPAGLKAGRTRQSGLTTHGRQDVRTRQSGLTTSQKPVILSNRPFILSSHGLLSVRTRPSGLTTPATPLRAEECRGHRSLYNPRDSHGLQAVRTRPSGLKTPANPLRAEECRGGSLSQKPVIRRTPGVSKGFLILGI